MRPIGIGLAAALTIALMAPASASLAQKKGDVDAKARTQGMSEAPAIAKKLGVSCTVADARFIGKSEDRKAKVTSSFYEIDCDQGPGMILQDNGDQPGGSFTCIEIATPGPDGKKSSLECLLPGNANAVADLAPLLSKAGRQCTPEKARGIGQSQTATYFEVQCAGNVGYIVSASAPVDLAKPVTAQDCLNYDDGEGNIKCTLSDKAARLAVVDRYAVEAKNGCQVKDRRFIGVSTDGFTFFEASCNDGKGYIYKITDKGALNATIDCAKAQGILGGCTLTDARVAATEQAALYTRLAGGVGFPCEVEKYAAFPSPAGKDVVELVCKGGKGGIGVFAEGGKGSVYSCGRSLVAGYRCSLNKAETGNADLTADLHKFTGKSCTVSDSRVHAKTQKNTILVEVACSDGLKGYMIEYNAEPVNAVAATSCAFSGGCKLPGNT